MTTGYAGVALIDLDNTLVRGSALFHFGAHLVRRRRLGARHVLRFAVAESRYAWAHAEPAQLPATVAERVLGLVRGRTQAEVVGWAQHFAGTRLSRHLVDDVVLAASDLKRSGYATYLVTASPRELAQAIAGQLGMTGAIGTAAEVSRGAYTGNLAGPIVHGAVKARLVRALLDEHGFSAESAFAFSDSVTDLPLLSMVGHPVATNPDRELSGIARANGWRILRSSDTATSSFAHLQVLFPHPY